MTSKQDIDFSDIQGLIRFGHGHLTESCFLLVKVNAAESARRWLASAPVTTAAPADPIPDQALQVAITAPGLRALGLTESELAGFSDEFIAGMASDDNRSRRLGDVGDNRPTKWTWGGAESGTPHLLLMLYTRAGGLARWHEQVRGPDFDSAFEIQNEFEAAARSTREPFGFVDGVSQPKIDWERRVSTDVHDRDRYSNRVALGELLLGHSNEYGLYTDRPLLDPESNPRARSLPKALDQPGMRDLGRNGTYLVMRQLAQDVPGFWRYLDREARSDSAERDRLAAAMVGRARDGSSLVPRTLPPIDGIDDEGAQAKINHFTFDEDPHGLRCPVGAHIRRSNPRTGDYPPGVDGPISRLIRTLGFGRRHDHDDLVASARFHRILRRGRAYGTTLSPEEAIRSDAPDADRGLHFVALGANISRQFEFVQNAWAVSPKFAGLPTESDPLLGNREALLDGAPTDRFTMPQGQGPARCLSGIPQFVTVRGGAYFFMPGISALRYLAGDAPLDQPG